MQPWILILIGFFGGSFVLWVVTTVIVSYRLTFALREKAEAELKLPSEPKGGDTRERRFDLFYEAKQLPYEEVEILSRDGLRLSARYYGFYEQAPLCICFHGYKSNALRDNYGMIGIGRAEGFNMLLVDQRAHGRSEGRTICFGIRERFDCADWIQYANNRFGSQTPVLLYGVSMGGATVLMASGLKLPQNVCGVIADCPFSSPRGIIRKVCVDMGFSPGVLMPFLYTGAFLLGGGLRIKKDISAKEAVKSARVPILLIHGEGDLFVPCDMSREIEAAAPDRIKLVTVPRADHAQSYTVDTPRYEREVSAFVRRVVSEQARRDPHADFGH